MPDEITLARIMTALDLEFERALHYHEEGYESDNDYELPSQVMRPLHVYSVSTTEASFNPADYKVAHCPISPFTPMPSRDELPFCQRVCWCLTFDETPHQKWTLTMNISLQLTLMTQHGLRSLYLIAKNTCAFTRYPDQQPHPCNLIRWRYPRARTNGYWDPRGPTRPHQCPKRIVIWLWLLGTQCARIPVVIWHLNPATENNLDINRQYV